MMKINLLPFLFLLLQLGACSSGIDDRIYGTWVDPFGQSEPVIFREDGTLSWFGEEGTFEAYHNHKTQKLGACSGQLSGWLCFEDDYTERGVRVLTPSLDFRIRHTHNCFFNDDCTELFYDDENHWRLDPNPSGGEDSVLLFRKSALVYPLMPEPFEKLGEDWGFPENEGFPWDGPLPRYFNRDINDYPIVSSNPIRAGKDGDYYVYNETNATWKKEQTPQQKSKSTLLVDCSYVGDASNRALKASLDQGSTWKFLPILSQDPYCWLGDTAVTETSIVRMFRSHDDDEYQLWTINAASESPLWVLLDSFDDYSVNNQRLYVHPTNGTIAWSYEFGREGVVSEISHDFGTTWKTFDLFHNEDPNRQCLDGDAYGVGALKHHHNGFYCLRIDDNIIRWYDYTSQK